MPGKCKSAVVILLVVLLLHAFMPPAGAQAEGSVTRSQTFTVTIVGLPDTAYYVWVAGTYALSGEPGDQPPVIEANQENILQDPPGGPYVIGSYKYYNGNGRTIRDDVAPTSSTVSDTSYYAQVTTDESGVAVVAFRTSQATAAQAFSIVAQNPAAPGQQVSVALGVPAQVPTPAALPAPVLPAAVPAATLTSPPVPAVSPGTAAAPVLSPVPRPVTTPPTTTPLPAVIAIAAAGTAFLVAGRNRK